MASTALAAGSGSVNGFGTEDRLVDRENMFLFIGVRGTGCLPGCRPALRADQTWRPGGRSSST